MWRATFFHLLNFFMPLFSHASGYFRSAMSWSAYTGRLRVNSYFPRFCACAYHELVDGNVVDVFGECSLEMLFCEFLVAES